jgi:hypothetical protein
MGQSRHARIVRRVVERAAAIGQQVGYFDVPGGAARLCETGRIKHARRTWGKLLAEPITPENPLTLDYATGCAWRGRLNARKATKTP